MVGERVEQPIERRAVLPRSGQVPRQRQARTPPLRVPVDQPLAQLDEPLRRPKRPVRPLQPVEREIRVVRHRLDQLFPRLDRRGQVPLPLADVPEIQVRGDGARIDVDRVRERARGAGGLTGSLLRAADLVAQEPEDLLVVRTPSGVDLGNLLANAQRVRPLMLVFVQLLQVDEGIPVARVELQDFLERLERAIDEPAVPEVETQAEQHVGVLQRGEVGPLQQRLVDVHGATHLPLLTVQVPQDHLDFERLGVRARGVRQFVDRLVNLVVHQEIEAEHVMRSLAKPPAVDPAPIPQLVPFPGLAHHQPQQQGEEHGQQV